MAHDVFISHAHKDITIANAIGDNLEAAQVKCWITERDIPAGENWPEATRNAIRSSRLVVLLLSENANAASHIEREIAHAFYTGRTIFPVRLTNTPLKRDFLYYLGNVRCFDAFNPPTEQYFEALVASVQGKMRVGAVPLNAVAPNAVPSRSARVERKTLDTSDSWSGAMRPPHYGGLQILKGVSVTVIFFSLLWLAWFVYSQGKIGESFGEGNLQTTDAASSPGSTPRASPPQAAAVASPSKPAYSYSRFGLWVTPDKAVTTETPKPPRPRDSAPVIPSETVTPSPKPDVDQDPTAEAQRSTIGGSAEMTKEGTELTNKAAPSGKAENRSESEKLAGINKNQELGPLPTPTMESTAIAEAAPMAESTPTAESTSAAEATPILQPSPRTESTPIAEATPKAEDISGAESTPAAKSFPTDDPTPSGPAPVSASTPAVGSTAMVEPTPTAPLTARAESRPAEASSGHPLRSSSEEQSLKQLVLDYLRTAASDDDSAQETFFSTRVNFYGKGMLSLSQVRASMKRYRQEWPVRSWQSRGEPEFPKALHADHPELYEVLQPFVWTVANGSERKKGTATLYVRIRKDNQGNFRIIHLEQRQP
jgi:hypothetical protein